jgi:hypothetical protein
MDTNSFLSLSTQQLRRAADLKEQIDQLNSELANILSGSAAPKRLGRPPKNNSVLGSQPAVLKTGRRMSAAGRARIAAAARARWARYNAEKGAAPKSAAASGPAKRRKMSPAARARIAAAAKARWAKAKAAGKNSL